MLRYTTPLTKPRKFVNKNVESESKGIWPILERTDYFCWMLFLMNDKEFLLIYDINTSKNLDFPYWQYPAFNESCTMAIKSTCD